MDIMLNKALEGFLGLLRQLIINLLGPKGSEWGEELKKFLRKEPCWINKQGPNLSIWKTVKVGVFNNLGVVKEMLSQREAVVSRYAEDILMQQKFTLAQCETDVSITLASVKKLTGKDLASFGEVIDAINDIGDLCPAEVALSILAEQSFDLPHTQSVVVAMKPIRNSEGFPYMFVVGRWGSSSKLHLHAVNTPSTGALAGDVKFVFIPRSF